MIFADADLSALVDLCAHNDWIGVYPLRALKLVFERCEASFCFQVSRSSSKNRHTVSSARDHIMCLGFAPFRGYGNSGTCLDFSQRRGVDWLGLKIKWIPEAVKSHYLRDTELLDQGRGTSILCLAPRAGKKLRRTTFKRFSRLSDSRFAISQ